MRLVLLHALPFDERMWDTSSSMLADAFVPALYGLGGSVEEWAAAILSECRDEELFVVGSSVGGSCALEVARAAPSRVRGIVLVGAKASVRYDHEARDAVVGVLQSHGVAAAWDTYWAPLFGATADPVTVAAARRLALAQSVDDLVTGVRAFHERRDHVAFVKEWRGRLLLVSGAQDRTPSPAGAAASVEGALSEQVIVEDCGHYVPLEQPDAFHRILANEVDQVHT